MLSTRRWMRSCVVVTLTMICMVFGLAGSAGAVDEKMLERMEQLIKQQQAQIEAQAKALEKLQQQVESLSENAVKEATAAAKAEVAKSAVPPDVIRNKGGEKVSVELYGQVDRAFLAADDGNSSDYYFVDNDNSSSRFGLLGEAKVNDDITIGTRMEFEYQSNPSNVVNQDNKDPDGSSFDDRWVDAQFTSKRFGKVYLGKGSTASDGTSEMDLSGTDVVGYASIADMAGGILFYDDNTNALSTTNIGDVFSDFDGLSRRNRIRYDTPELWGFKLSGSLLSDGGDVALRYAAKWGEDWKFAAAAAYANPQATSNTVDNQYNGSASVLHSSGLNLTVSGGYQDLDSGLLNPDGTTRDDDPTFYYAKVGYRAKWFQVGETRFSLDYGRNDDVAQDGDEAKTVGFQVVQDFPEWGSEYYLGYRWHELDRDLADFNDINALMTGVRVKF
jgi:cell division protein FtsB